MVNLANCNLLIVLLYHLLLPLTAQGIEQRNDRPIVGILAQETDEDDSISYIAAPYVKQMESAGARVVPILIKQEESYYRRIIQETNGLVIPGGHLNMTGNFFRQAAELLFKFATEAHDRGIHYPIYGVCRGLQLVTLLILKQWANHPRPYWLTSCSAEDISLNLKFLVDPDESRIFKSAAPSIIHTLTSNNVTPNYHQKCMTPENVKKSGLDEYLRILTTSIDSNGLEFVSTFESVNKSRPIYLLQWHPEKIVFEFRIIDGIQINLKHSAEAVQVAQFVTNFVVEEARKNLNTFVNPLDEDNALISNCNPIYTMNANQNDSVIWRRFSQLYWFPSSTGCQPPDGGQSFNYYEIGVGSFGLILAGIVVGFFITRIFFKRTEYEKINENS